MVGEGTPPGLLLEFGDAALAGRIVIDPHGIARLSYLTPGPPASDTGDAGQPGLPLLDVVLGGTGRAWSGRRYCESVVGGRMRYVDHSEEASENGRRLRINLEDPSTLVVASVVLELWSGTGALRSKVAVTNAGDRAVGVASVTSFLGGGLAGPAGSLDDVVVWWAENDWLSESRWQSRALRDALPDLNRHAHRSHSRACFSVTGAGSWSSGTFLPMGAVANTRTGYCLLWQVEHNGAWHWQVGEASGVGPGSTYLALLGPTDLEHHWRPVLQPGESFETVPVSVVVSPDGFEGALARVTAYRRAARRPHGDHRKLPVIFNDYMNTLMGDPTTEKLIPLISAAASAGAEVFCIDAGWYSELGEAWWDSVGAWRPSTTRFPAGIGEVLDHIRSLNMVPGLWIEPEVVGVRSAVARSLPDEAFFLRDGERVIDQGRHHLDLRHPAARRHLDAVVDFLVGELGIGYLKMDYNVDFGPGTEAGGVAAGVGLLGHNRALLAWLDAVLDRHDGLTIENCASGGLRADFAQLSRLQLQSTSDQQDYLRYPAISAAAPSAMTPEQAATWAYPQPEWSDEQITFVLCGAMLGRFHLSGNLDRMSAHQRELVADALSIYKQIRQHIAAGTPFWPLGMPGWNDSWLALGLRSPVATHLLAWHRGLLSTAADHQGDGDPGTVTVPLAHLHQRAVSCRVLYPASSDAKVIFDPSASEVTIGLESSPSACLIELRAR